MVNLPILERHSLNGPIIIVIVWYSILLDVWIWLYQRYVASSPYSAGVCQRCYKVLGMVVPKTQLSVLEAVAKEAQVSPRTAYRILNGEGIKGRRKDARERAERIMAAGKRLGYRPNQAARMMRNKKFGTVALILSRGATTSTLPKTLLSSIHDELARHDYHLAITRLSDSELALASTLPRVLKSLMVDGLMLFYTHHEPPELNEYINQFQIPAIWINNARQSDCVHPDDREGGRLATLHLLNLGHRNIAYWNFNQYGSQHYSGVERHAGYVEAMQSFGCLPIIQHCPLRPCRADDIGDDYVVAGRALLRERSEVTAIVGYSAAEGMVATIAALSLGWSLPQDLSVIFVDQSVEDIAGLGLTRFHASTNRLGQQVVSEWLAKVNDLATPRMPVRIPFELFPGRSCTAYADQPRRPFR